MMRLDTLPLQDRSVCNSIEVTMSVVYAVEGSSSLAHHQIIYATDETLQHHTSCYGPSFAQAFLNALRLHYKSIRINLAFAAISMTSTLSQLYL